MFHVVVVLDEAGHLREQQNARRRRWQPVFVAVMNDKTRVQKHSSKYLGSDLLIFILASRARG